RGPGRPRPEWLRVGVLRGVGAWGSPVRSRSPSRLSRAPLRSSGAWWVRACPEVFTEQVTCTSREGEQRPNVGAWDGQDRHRSPFVHCGFRQSSKYRTLWAKLLWLEGQDCLTHE